MKLYYSEVLNPRKTCAVATYLKSPVSFERVSLARGEHRTPAFRALNPNAKVPVLVDGDTTLWESNAIMCYLARKAGSDLWPQDDRQIEILRWLMWDANEFSQQAGTLYFEYIIKPYFGLGGPDPGAVAQATEGFERLAAVLESHLTGRSYLVGDALSVADFAVAITLPYASEAHLPLGGFPQMRRWYAQLDALEAWRHPFPTRPDHPA